MRRFGLARALLLPFLAAGCFQSECPETKGRLLDRFNPASPTFDVGLLSPAPQGAAAGDFQAILDAAPSRCLDLSDEFRASAINGVDGLACSGDQLGEALSDGSICHRATESTIEDPLFVGRIPCADALDETCPAGTACINISDDEDPSLDGFRCDNPNQSVCQQVLRELSGARCVECDEMELLICECREGASLFKCLSAFVSQSELRVQLAEETCLEATGGPEVNANAFDDCVDDFAEANTRDERNACFGVNNNIPRLNDGASPDCSRYAFLQENGENCGADLECTGNRCAFTNTEEFSSEGDPLDPIDTKVCTSDCASDGAGGLFPDLGRCTLGFFCSDNIAQRDGSPDAFGCISLDDPSIPFADDFSTVCDPTDATSCGLGRCELIPVDETGNLQPRCTFTCTAESEDLCGAQNQCVIAPGADFGFCAP